MIRSLPFQSRLTLRVSFALIVCLMLFVALGSSAAAAPPTVVRETSKYASAYVDSCVTEIDGTYVCSNLMVDVFADGADWSVCMFRSSATYPTEGQPVYSDEYGCTSVAGNAFTMDAKKLTFASLSPVVIPLSSFACDENYECSETSREATLSGSWTGTGNLVRFNNRSTYKDGKCTFTFSGKGEHRDASVSLTLDGQVIEMDYGSLSSSKSFFRISSSCE